jgi:starch phosphorylase
VLDGWWAESYDGGNGWAIPGEVDGDHEAQDARHAATFFRLLEEEVIPCFYERDAAGLPRAWIARMKASLRSIGPTMNAARMLDDYVAHAYAEKPG